MAIKLVLAMMRNFKLLYVGHYAKLNKEKSYLLIMIGLIKGHIYIYDNLNHYFIISKNI